MLALILGVLWFVVIFIVLVQKLCLFLSHAIAEDTHRTDVDVLEECFLLDCYLVCEVFQHPTMEKITTPSILPLPPASPCPCYARKVAHGCVSQPVWTIFSHFLFHSSQAFGWLISISV